MTSEIPSSPLSTSAPTPSKTYEPTKECWCPADASTDCRFHKVSVCPNKGLGVKPRLLYASTSRKIKTINFD